MVNFGKSLYRSFILRITTLIQSGVSILQRSPVALGPVFSLGVTMMLLVNEPREADVQP